MKPIRMVYCKSPFEMTGYLIIIRYLWIIIESMVRRLQKFVGGYDGFISPKIRTNFLCRNAEFSSFPLTPFTDISRGGVLAFFYPQFLL